MEGPHIFMGLISFNTLEPKNSVHHPQGSVASKSMDNEEA